MYVDDDNESASHNATYFDSFGVEHNLKQIKKLIGNKNIATNVFRIQAYYSIMCGCVLILLVAIDFMLKSKSSLDYTNLFSPNTYEKHDKIIRKYLQ